MLQGTIAVSERSIAKSRKPYAVMQTADAVRDYCTDLLWDIAPASPGETVKAWLHRAAVATGLKPSTVKRLRYQEMPVVPAHVAFLLQDVAARQIAARERLEALKVENDRILGEVRAGRHPMRRQDDDPSSVDAFGTEETRQLALPFRGWMRK